MNGFCLLLALSSVGAAAAVESSASGQPVYVIRLERELVDLMNRGQEVPIHVERKDRQVREFRIAVGADTRTRASAAPRGTAARPEDLVEQQAYRVESGEIWYYIQITPERMLTLANGRAIEGTIPDHVPEVHQYRIFVGVDRMPATNAAAPAAGTETVGLTPTDSAIVPAAATVRATDAAPRGATSAAPRAAFQATAAPSGSLRGFGATSAPPATNYFPERQTALRNSPDSSTVAPPQFTNMGTSGTAYPGSNLRTGTTAQPNYTTSAASPPSYGQPGYQAPPFAQTAGATAPQNPYANPQYTSGAGVPTVNDPNWAYQQQQLQLQQQAAAAAAAAWQQGMGAYPQLAARPEMTTTPSVPTASPTAGGAAAGTGTTSAGTGATSTAATTAPSTGSNLDKTEHPPERPWTPLILTTLALFASLGANAYLGWLSWSFFWRFRDAVNESSRARSHHASFRQAA